MPYSALPRPPYFVAIVRSMRNAHDEPGYRDASAQMFEQARLQPGFLGVHSVREPGGDGITLSYWSDEASIRAWRADDAHGVVRETGRRDWYAGYTLQIARVDRAYSWDAGDGSADGAVDSD